ncbi:MAG TPA: hypothetical protein VKQ52_06790 [Puia sp.]|nr:hypothetical protein [Puia sp.]
MEDFAKVENLVDHVKDYMHVRVDEARLGIAERSSGAVAFLAAGVAVTGIFTLCFTFIGIGAALLIGRVLDDLVSGFLIVAAFQFLLGLIIWRARQRLIRIPIMNAILQQLLSNKTNDEDN